MFERIRMFFIGLAVLCITGWSHVSSTCQLQEEKVTIRGTVEANDVDEDCTVVTVVISVEEDEEGNKTIFIKSYRVLQKK